jgi:hypothetical protein
VWWQAHQTEVGDIYLLFAMRRTQASLLLARAEGTCALDRRVNE